MSCRNRTVGDEQLAVLVLDEAQGVSSPLAAQLGELLLLRGLLARGGARGGAAGAAVSLAAPAPRELRGGGRALRLGGAGGRGAAVAFCQRRLLVAEICADRALSARDTRAH